MSQVMNKKALIDAVAEKLDITKKDATVAVETVFDTIVESLVNGNKVDISGFGKFEVKTRKGRVGINPSTKEIKTKENASASSISSFKFLLISSCNVVLHFM